MAPGEEDTCFQRLNLEMPYPGDTYNRLCPDSFASGVCMSTKLELRCRVMPKEYEG